MKAMIQDIIALDKFAIGSDHRAVTQNADENRKQLEPNISD